MKKRIITKNLEEFISLVQIIAKNSLSRLNLDNGGGATVLALYGELGAGKTTFARAFAETLGVKEKIKSPTFIIFRKSKIENKEWSEKVFENFYHFDVYRIHNEKEILNLGWEEIISNPRNIVLVEWADKIESILPKNHIEVVLKHKEEGKREVEVMMAKV
ncbi:TPA: tRNA (adenosine(37)-N6)-threonylcarbamoyltransferase complex ATPase subunit type 1 TsaE [Patescibacteria group bacterium]|nr:MAG: ATP/GTP hydrolase [Parcubacteria group bacterium GW2011_GWF2_40_10]KKR47931.1 MAG: ATP/GTP hydrolase [Parcubacteria group bacterium GW2011_GWA2_40_143]KKR60379.1 MAG: ATP/GTP hydrolase [Parcubacteria group bacterium GW2011_GWC2_40_31]KKR75266.1 MAG: ATP/GTP hydrolase [Parcubacteria group bacterium GW2011_GWB2_40_8]KKR76662.1 MAG: ATP/GTP hydrolase [Parcubacteria group bacterium GW2011_GWE2_40_8]KKR80301.1 MAG: ATP/GTP hydrolase [Parcubacteria group bacterium GW2011_GWD2_40_9]HBB56752.